MSAVVLLLSALLASTLADPLAADSLACEHSIPSASFYIDTPFPRLSWTPGLFVT